MSTFSWRRVFAVCQKDAAELIRNPGAIVPAIMMVIGSLLPAFMVIIGAPMLAGETLAESGDFADAALSAVAMIPEMAGLSGNALIQAFLFHQFFLLLLLVPIVAAMALASHAVIGEKQSKALEPLLATPISTLELLAAKALTPFLFSVGLSWSAVLLYILGAVLMADAGVWQAIVGPRLFIMFGLLGPLAALAALLVAVIVSSRTSDPRSAQQISGLLILPVTAVFVAQLMGAFIVGPRSMLFGSLGCVMLNLMLFWVGVRVFQRESILTRWK